MCFDVDLVLQSRLRACYDLIRDANPDAVRVIDVGSDHGLLSVCCLKTDVCKSVVCTDIHKAPADRTRQTLLDYNLDGRFEVYCVDGLCGVLLNPGDVVVIAGMGGNTIVDIISEVVSRTSENVLCSTDFVLQPQKSIERVREDLSRLGFVILEERVVVDRDIHYSLLHLKYSPLSKSITLEEKYLGPILITKMREGNNEVINYFRHLKSILEVRARGNEEIRQLLDSNIWEEIK